MGESATRKSPRAKRMFEIPSYRIGGEEGKDEKQKRGRGKRGTKASRQKN